MNPLITKADLPAYVQFSTNIEDRLVNFHTTNAQVYDLEVRLGAELYNDLILLPTVPPAPDTRAQLRSFYENYVKRYLALNVYCRFMAEHGTNITQYGVTQLGDPGGTFTQATEERRAIFLKQYRSDMDVAMTRMFNRLKDVNYTFDSISYDKEKSEKKKSLPISSIRRKNISDSPFKEELYNGIY